MDIREVAESLLVVGTALNLDAANGTEIVLFTVPAGKSCIITKVVTHTHSAALTTAKSEYGFNTGTANNVITAALKALTGATNYQIVVADDDAVRGAAGDDFSHCVDTKETSALTCKVDVFGYLY